MMSFTLTRPHYKYRTMTFFSVALKYNINVYNIIYMHIKETIIYRAHYMSKVLISLPIHSFEPFINQPMYLLYMCMRIMCTVYIYV